MLKNKSTAFKKPFDGLKFECQLQGKDELKEEIARTKEEKAEKKRE